MKMMMLHKAKRGTSLERFTDIHESQYVPLVERLLPSGIVHRRHYITSERSPALVAIGSPFKDVDFDLISEFRLSNPAEEASLRDIMARTDVQNAGAQIFEDMTTIAFIADEAFTPAENLAPRPAGGAVSPNVRTFILLKKRPSMSRQQFIDHYEGQHAALALKHLAQDGTPVFATYRRNYPKPHVGSQEDAGGTLYDCLSEICYWDERGAEGFARALSQVHVAQIFDREQDVMLDRDAVALVQVATRPEDSR